MTAGILADTRTEHLQNTSLQSYLWTNQQYTVPNDGQLVNNELEMVWKEAVMASFMTLHRHLPVSSEEAHQNPQL
jgi:hypothetical protein